MGNSEKRYVHRVATEEDLKLGLKNEPKDEDRYGRMIQTNNKYETLKNVWN